MKKSQVLTLISETGRKVEEEKFLIGTDSDIEVIVKYSYEFQDDIPPSHVVYQIFEEAKHVSGTYVSEGLNITKFNKDYTLLYSEIEKTCISLMEPASAI
jgi:hypothetical protein